MGAVLDTLSLWIILPQVLALAVTPLLVHHVLTNRREPAMPGTDKERSTYLTVSGRRAIAGLAGLAFLVMYGGVSIPALELALSIHAEERLYDRLIIALYNPLTVAVVIAAIILLPILAALGVGSVGFWMFDIALLFPAYWFGLGALSPSFAQDWPIVAAAAAAGALLGAILAQIAIFTAVRSGAESKARWHSLVIWAGAGAYTPLVGALIGWLVARSVEWDQSGRKPFGGDLPATLLLLAVAMSVGLAAAAVTGVFTGHLTLRARWLVLPALALVPLSVAFTAQASPASHSTRPFQVLTAEGGSVDSLAFTSDGNLLAAGLGPDVVQQEKSGALIVWRTSNWSVLKSLTLDAGTPDIAFAPDGQTLAVASTSGSIQLYRVSNWSLIRKVSMPGRAGGVSVAFSPDGSILARATSTEIQLWNTSDWSPARTLQVDEMYEGGSLAFSPDGQYLATGSADWKVRLWRVRDGSLARSFDGHSQEVTSLAFSADGKSLASTSWDDTVRVWSTLDGHLLHSHELTSQAVAFSPDGQLVVAGSIWAVPELWRVSDGTLLSRLLSRPDEDGINSKTFSIAFSPDGHTIAGGSQYQEVRLWTVPP